MSARGSRPGRPRRRGGALLPAALVVVTLAAGGGATVLLRDAAAATGEETVVPAVRGSLTVGVAAVGTVASRSSTPLAFATDGTVSNVLVNPGTVVAAGDLVATLDDGVARTRLDAANQRLTADTAARDTLKAAPPAAAPAPATPADPTTPVDPATPATTTTTIGADPVALSRLEGAVADDRTAVAEAQAGVAATELRAPRAGTVTALSAAVGAPVALAQGGGVVGTVADLGDLSLVVGVAPADVARIAAGQRADATVDGAPGRIDGHVESVSPAPGPTGSYDVTLGVEAPPGTLRVGQRAVARVVVGEAEGALLVPRRAVSGAAGADTVTVRAPAGDRRVPVGIGLVDSTTVQITRGLAAGDPVVVPADASSGGTP